MGASERSVEHSNLIFRGSAHATRSGWQTIYPNYCTPTTTRTNNNRWCQQSDTGGGHGMQLWWFGDGWWWKSKSSGGEVLIGKVYTFRGQHLIITPNFKWVLKPQRNFSFNCPQVYTCDAIVHPIKWQLMWEGVGFECKTASMGIIIMIMLKGAHTEWMWIGMGMRIRIRIRIAQGYRSTFSSFPITTRIIHVYFCAGGISWWWSLQGKFMSVHLSRISRWCDRRFSCRCPRRKSKVILGSGTHKCKNIQGIKKSICNEYPYPRHPKNNFLEPRISLW